MPNVLATAHLMPFFKGDLMQTVKLSIPDELAGDTLGSAMEAVFAIGNGMESVVPWTGRRSMSVGDVVVFDGKPDAWVVLGCGWRTLREGEMDRLCAMDFSSRQIALAPRVA